MQFSQELSTLALSVFDRPYAKINTMLNEFITGLHITGLC